MQQQGALLGVVGHDIMVISEYGNCGVLYITCIHHDSAGGGGLVSLSSTTVVVAVVFSGSMPKFSCFTRYSFDVFGFL